MPHQITIKPSDHSFAADDGETVLAAAIRADLMIPYGCRNGACGTCKCRVQSGEYDGGDYIEDALTDEEAAEGLALACQAKPTPATASASPSHGSVKTRFAPPSAELARASVAGASRSIA